MTSFKLHILIVSLGLLMPSVQGCCDRQEIPTLERSLSSAKAKERNDAALALARCGDDASAAVGRLSELLYDENVGVQSAAAYALRKIDTQAAREYLKRAEAARRKH